MRDLLIAIAVMVAVAGPLMAWIVWADRRRRRQSGDSPGMGKEEVA